MQEIKVGDKELVDTKFYTVATKAYIANGKDGFDMFNDPEVTKQGSSQIVPT